MKIQVLSDLHLEFPENNFRFFDAGADVIVLAGDIGNWKNSLKLINTLFSQDRDIVYVAGNHEFYGTSLEEGYNFLDKESRKYPNIHFLEKSVFEKGDAVFLGTTLWSDFNLFGDYHRAKKEVKRRIADFSYIKKLSGENITPDFIRERFEQSLQFLEESMNKCSKKHKNIVVITHHLPSKKALSPYSFKRTILGYDPTPSAFASNLDNFIEAHPEITLWIHGHSHYNYPENKIRIGNTILTCNQLGYYFEETRFLKDFCITI